MKDFNLAIEPVLEKELYTTPPLMPVIVARIVGTKSDIPEAFRLTKDLAFNDLKHLRRIRNSPDSEVIDCIICKLQDANQSEENNELGEVIEKFADHKIFTDFRIVRVPSSAPRTNHQLKCCNSIWPCKFAKSNYLINCIEGEVFSDAKKLVLKIIVNNLLKYLSDNSDKVTSGSVIFRRAKIYGIGLSSAEILSSNPTKHSTMISIDSVATQMNAGHWKENNHNDLLELLQRKLDEEDIKFEQKPGDANFIPYLCTNYDVFVTEEPCFMCTMGLVQSRVRRLFYLGNQTIERTSYLQSICQPDKAIELHLVHRERNLNHRFEAWKISILPED